MSFPILEVIAVMAVSGAVGGVAGYFARLVAGSVSKVDEKLETGDGAAQRWYIVVFSDILMGIVASFAVPLFLAFAQSKLIDNISRAPDANWDILTFSGYCLIAAFSARLFLQNMSGHLLSQAQAEQKHIRSEQKAIKDEVADLAEMRTAPLGAYPDVRPPMAPTSPSGDASAGAGGRPAEIGAPLTGPAMVTQRRLDVQGVAWPIQLSANEKKIIESLVSEQYARRSLTGVSKASGVTKPEAGNALARLEQSGLVMHGESANTGSLMYQLTPKAWGYLGRQ